MRSAEIVRNTLETQITVAINLDGTGDSQFSTGLGFLDHMIDQIARHGMMDISVNAKGDLHIDAHHTVEDIGITLGEALSRVVLDISGRPGLEFSCVFTRASIGEFDVDLIHEFFQGFVNHANVTLHIDNLKGHNAHHQAETIFKAFGRALRVAVELDSRMAGIMPSTKGSL
jgi:imidazoleglycerol-phosphate dehydratase